MSERQMATDQLRKGSAVGGGSITRRQTYHAESKSGEGLSEMETGRKTKRRTITLSEAAKHTTRGRIVAVTRHSHTSARQSKAASASTATKQQQQEAHEDVDEHFLTLPVLAKRYGVSIDFNDPARSQGLTKEEAAKRLAEEGRNQLTPPKGQNPIKQYLLLLTDPLTAMLLTAAVLSLASQAASTENYSATYLGVVLVFVVFCNVTVDFVQARKSEAMVKSLSSLAPTMASAVRNGATVSVNAAELVRGDIVMLNMGDKVPADVRLIKVTDMTVDNSNLTGEGDPQQRMVEAHNPGVLEAENLAFMGTMVVGGKGFGVIIKRGDETVLGKISALAGADKSDMTSPLTKEIKAFVVFTGSGAVIIAAIVFAIAMGIGLQFSNAIALSIGIFVAAALCGMPATITMLLAYASKELSKYNVLVKNLHGMDTLGAITLLCSDKTGTLTMNIMTVVELWQYNKPRLETAKDETVKAETDTNGTDFESNDELMIMALCNSAHFVRSPENLALPIADREAIGDATETALLRHASQYTDIDALRQRFAPVVEVPFNSDRKYSAGVFEKPHKSGLYTVYFKGAPERVVRRCTYYRVYNSTEILPMDDQLQAQYQETYESMAGKGQRVIACAMLELDSSKYSKGHVFTAETCPSEDLIFVGLIALQDPPKPGVAQAIDECNTAGIQVMMITGDHPLTAEAIARDVHIIKGKTKAMVAKEKGINEKDVKVNEYDAVVLHGETLLSMSEDEWAEALSKKEVAFARTSPQQKLEIVTRAQAMGHVCGMTGDGVNDSPALRRADMGIAMAITGSEVSREAASLVLLDDNFTSVVEGIKRGRIIFASMKKAIAYTLAHIMGEIFPAILLIALGLPLAMSPFLVLFIDLGTEIAPVMCFAFERADDNVMTKKPRRAVVPQDVEISPEEIAQMERNTQLEVAEADEEEIEEEEEKHHSLLYRVFDRSFGRCVRAISTGSKNHFRKANPGDEQLVDGRVFRFAFLQNAFFAIAAGLINYFLVFNHNGIPPSELYRMVPDFFPSEGEAYTYNGRTYSEEEQADILNSVQSSYYFTVAIMQFFAAYLLKATDGHVFCSRAAWRNKATYYAIIFSTGVAFFVTHVPGVQFVLESARFPLWTLAIAIGVGFVHLAFESLRRKVFHVRSTI